MKTSIFKLFGLCLLAFWLGGGALFAQGFSVSPIPDAVFQRMYGKSYKKDCTIPRSTLRYVKVRHYTLDGKVKDGELVCHKDIAHDLMEVFRELYQVRYPIERIELIDNYGASDEKSMTANNTSAFNFRHVAGTRVLSNHSYGKAVDINPLYNPYVAKGGKVVQPKAGRPYADRTRKFPYKITANDVCCRIFKKHGFKWGGDWKSKKDYQHFEKQ